MHSLTVALQFQKEKEGPNQCPVSLAAAVKRGSCLQSHFGFLPAACKGLKCKLWPTIFFLKCCFIWQSPLTSVPSREARCYASIGTFPLREHIKPMIHPWMLLRGQQQWWFWSLDTADVLTDECWLAPYSQPVFLSLPRVFFFLRRWPRQLLYALQKAWTAKICFSCCIPQAALGNPKESFTPRLGTCCTLLSRIR